MERRENVESTRKIGRYAKNDADECATDTKNKRGGKEGKEELGEEGEGRKGGEKRERRRRIAGRCR